MNNFYLNRREMLKALGLLSTSAALAACGPTGAPPAAAPAAAEPTARNTMA
jgi:predicted small lipoprotein YifL